MQSYEQFVKYNNFVKDSIFQKLQTIITNKFLIESSRQEQLQDLIRQIERDIIRIKFDREEFQKQHPEIQTYIDVFKQMKDAVMEEYEACFDKLKDIEDSSLLLIRRCKAAEITAQKKLLQFIRKRDEEETQKIAKLTLSIAKQYKKIDEFKLECFVSMLRFINEMSEDNIKAKFLNIQDEANSKFYGAQRSYMNDLIEEIEGVEDNITQQIVQLRALEKEKNDFVAKASHKLYDLEKSKIKVIGNISQSINPRYQIPKSIFKEQIIIEDSKLEFVPPKDYTKLNFIKKSKHLTLNSHKLNEALISHRHTLADFMVSRQTSMIIDQERQKSIEKLEKDENFSDYIKFLEEMQIAVKNKGDNQKLDNDFLQKFIKTQGKKQYRQLLIFFLFEANQNKGQRLYAFNAKESELVKQMVYFFLLNCRELYDSQSALKMLMISYHVNLKDGGCLYTVLRDNQIWKISQFWETSFIESVYEYFDVVVMFYHKELERNERTGQTHTTKSNWFTNLFKIRPFWVINSPEVEEQKNPLQQFYREIIKNLALIYVANMILLFVPPQIIEKFKKYILDAVTHLEWSPQYITNLQHIFEVAMNRGQNSLKKLLSDSNVLQRVMSKLLGANSQPRKQTEISLSKSIAMWIDEK